MTDLTKAIDFATDCLKWTRVETLQNKKGILVYDADSTLGFYLDSFSDISSFLEKFLAKRFSIQINRGTSSLFKWSVIVGLQNRIAGPPLVFDQGRGDSDDMLDAIFDACTAAARLYSNA